VSVTAAISPRLRLRSWRLSTRNDRLESRTLSLVRLRGRSASRTFLKRKVRLASGTRKVKKKDKKVTGTIKTYLNNGFCNACRHWACATLRRPSSSGPSPNPARETPQHAREHAVLQALRQATEKKQEP
jgi:hypothetical protein